MSARTRVHLGTSNGS
ncbi:hypothetical protein MTR67_000095 [Solanum verrucosum]|uniref:Uncharacterized protein n=1 Tax=Solanum verrucosum TaxID=315347 RepID=A0AAF0PN13_SOLVR|nr:hypothetical protein MTR67_000095 [Solanum verrucosum]